MTSLLHDLRTGLRFLGRTPALTTIAVLTLMLGAGAISSVLIVINAVLLQPLPYEEPEELQLISGTMKRGETLEEWPLSYLDLSDLRERNRVFEQLVMVTDSRSLNLWVEGGETRIVGVEMVSAEYFELLGAQPLHGRFFLPEEDDAPGASPVVVLSHELWQRRYGGDPAALGGTLYLDDLGFTILGVLPAEFRGVDDETEAWIPISMATMLGSHYLETRELRWLSAIGRLRDGVGREEAQQELDRITRQLEEEHPEVNYHLGARATPLREAWFGELRTPLFMLLGAAAFVLLIVLTNLANLQLVRAMERQKEVTLRLALGARRIDVIRQLLTESVLLALFGAAAGLLFAHLFTGAFIASSGLTLRSFVAIRIDPSLVAVVLVVLAFCGLVFGLWPALLVSDVSLAQALKEGGRQASSSRRRNYFQNALCVAEMALAVSLLVGAGLMIKGFERHTRQDLGFQSEHLLSMTINLTRDRYATDEPVRSLVRRAVEELGALPGVRSVALAGPGMPAGDWIGGYVSLADRAVFDNPDGTILVSRHHVSPGYFSTLGIPLLGGRDVSFQDDTDSENAAVVSQTLAERLWPGKDGIGERLKLGSLDSPYPWVTVVGVAGDVRHEGLGSIERPGPDVYFALQQLVPRTPRLLHVLVRTETPPARLVAALRQRFASLAPGLGTYDVATMEERLARQSSGGRFMVLLVNGFALTALALATVGIYGILSYSVTQRVREIGIRMALGAKAGDVSWQLLYHVGRLAALGTGLGLLLAWVLTRLLTSRLYGVSPLDPFVLVAAPLLLLAVAFVASYFPARRASRLTPMAVLREE